jgi:hypothetical protein
MIIQKSFETRVIAISQTAHAWVSGQMARHWGNERFSGFAPVEPLCYAAEQHDRGFLDWERQPTLNPKSGLPHTFEHIPLRLNLELRKKSILELKAVSLYASLVTSMHFARALGNEHAVESYEDRQRVAEFISEQKNFSGIFSVLFAKIHICDRPVRISRSNITEGSWPPGTNYPNNFAAIPNAHSRWTMYPPPWEKAVDYL